MKKQKNSNVKDQLVEDSCDPQMMTGQSIRISECSGCVGEGHQNGVQITRVSDGWTWWCYRCSHGGKLWDIGMAPADSLKRLNHMRRMLDKKYSRKVELPEDFTTEIPSEFLQWLYSYELDHRDVIDYGMGYSPDHHRLIIPVYITGLYRNKLALGKMIAWMGRSLTDTKTNPKWHMVREFGIKYVYYALCDPFSKTVVVVEDVVSAIKIHRAGYNAVALLTTYVPNELYVGLKGYNVKVWLDPDAQIKSIKAVQKFVAFGIPAQHLKYHMDPKDCPYDKIPSIVD